MKRIVFTSVLLLSLLVFCRLSKAQDIPNHSFEYWEGNEPTDWGTSNYSLMGFTWDVVKQETNDAQDGNSSAKLTVVKKAIPFFGSYSIPGAITLGEFFIDLLGQQVSISGGVPFTGMPTKLTGYLKYEPVNNDTCYIGWGLSKFNGVSTDTIALAAIDTFGLINEWTYFEVPADYQQQINPDTMNIIISCSNPIDGLDHTGTKLLIDNLVFEYGGIGIEGVTFINNIQIYALRDSKHLKIVPEFNKLTNTRIDLYNTGGQVLKSWNKDLFSEPIVLDLSEFKTGIYIITFTNNKGVFESRKVIVH